MYKKNKKIIIFGGSGFLASHVADKLILNGYDVIIFDNKKSKYMSKGQKFFQGDILKLKNVLKVTKNAYAVYHFAGVSDIDTANQFPYKTLNINIFGTINILEACVKNKIKQIIFASSIYALSDQGGFYSTSKLTSEMIIERYSKKFKFNFNILRFGSLYGPRFNYFNSIGKYINQAKKIGKIIRFSNGNEKRNYINVLDAADICIEVLKSKFKNKYYNLLGKKKYKVRNVLNLIAKEMKVKKIIYNNKNSEYHYNTNPYTYKLRKGTLLYPKKEINLSLGIRNVIKELK